MVVTLFCRELFRLPFTVCQFWVWTAKVQVSDSLSRCEFRLFFSTTLSSRRSSDSLFTPSCISTGFGAQSWTFVQIGCEDEVLLTLLVAH